MRYLIFFTLSFISSALLTHWVRKLAYKFNILDLPNANRKIHKKPIPLLGGLGIFGSFFFIVFLYLIYSKVDFSIIPLKYFYGILLGGAVLITGGAMDDKFNLPAKITWIFPALASLIAIYFGIGGNLTQISNPFGGVIDFNLTLNLFNFINFSLGWLVVFLWLMGMIYTTKFLDGLDGLSSGISLIGGLTLFALSLLPHINQNITASLAIIFCGTLAGFLIFNFHPASIFLGEGGSTLLGFILGILSIILGGKIATALLVMGIPILDVAWVITRRIWYKGSPFKADRKHLHFRLLDLGFSQPQAVGILWSISGIFGFMAIFLQSKGKLIALGGVFVVMLILAISVVLLYKHKHPYIEK